MANFKSFFNKWILNKYIITILIFIILITFFGEYSLIKRTKNYRTIKELEQEKEMYTKQAQQFEHDINLLNSNTDSLEHFAREQYYMHAPGETVYLIDEK